MEEIREIRVPLKMEEIREIRVPLKMEEIREIRVPLKTDEIRDSLRSATPATRSYKEEIRVPNPASIRVPSHFPREAPVEF